MVERPNISLTKAANIIRPPFRFRAATPRFHCFARSCSMSIVVSCSFLVPFALHIYYSMVLAHVKWGYAFSEKIFQGGGEGGVGIRWSSCRMHGTLYAHEA